MVKKNEREVIWVPKSHTDKMSKVELIEFAVKQFYKHEPKKAKAFEQEMRQYQDEPQMGEALQMMYKIPDMVFNFLRSVDHDFWHPKRGLKNYKLFGEIYKKAKVVKTKTKFAIGSDIELLEPFLKTTGKEVIINE